MIYLKAFGHNITPSKNSINVGPVKNALNKNKILIFLNYYSTLA